MARHRLLVPALAVALALTGCADAAAQSEPTETAATEPATVDITVELVDINGHDFYFNLDDEQCVAEYLGHEEVQAPEIRISDGADRILAVEDGPETGGTFTDGQGCTVPVEFTDVPASEVYVVAVTGTDGVPVERTVDGSNASTITVQL